MWELLGCLVEMADNMEGSSADKALAQSAGLKRSGGKEHVFVLGRGRQTRCAVLPAVDGHSHPEGQAYTHSHTHSGAQPLGLRDCRDWLWPDLG